MMSLSFARAVRRQWPVLLLALGGLSIAHDAAAQRIVDGELSCGDEVQPLGGTVTPGLSAAQLRLDSIQRLDQNGRAALAECSTSIMVGTAAASACDLTATPNCLPGCERLATLIAQRHALPAVWAVAAAGATLTPAILEARRGALLQDDRIVEAAVRVLAHAECRRDARSGNAREDCSRLQALEDGPRAPLPPTLMAAVAPGATAGGAFEQLAYYAGWEANLGTASGAPPASLTEEADAIVSRRQVAAAPPAAVPLTGSFAALSSIVAAEHAHEVTSDAACSRADLYVSPDGEYTLKPGITQVATVCFAIGTFSVSDAFTFTLRDGLQRLEGVAWPNEPTQLTKALSTNASFSSLALYARPRATTLLSFARHKSILGPDEADLVTQDQLLRQRRVQLDAKGMEGLALDDLGKDVSSCVSTVYLSKFKAVRKQIKDIPGNAKPDDTAVLNARGALLELLGLIEDELNLWMLGTPGCRPGTLQFPFSARESARLAVVKVLPSLPTNDAASFQAALNAIEILGANARDRANQLKPVDDEAKLLGDQRAFENKLRRLCELAAHPVLVVTHDLTTAANEQSIEYDFDTGLLGGTALNVNIDEDRPIVVRVRHVPPKGGVRIELDDKGIAQSVRRVVGAEFSAAALTADKAEALASSRVQQIEPTSLAGPLGFAGTQFFRFPRLEGGRRYKLAVCVASEVAPSSCAAPSGVRLLGTNQLLVHGEWYLGVRLALAGGALFTPTELVPRRQNGDGMTSLWKVTERRASPLFMVPVLATWYPWGRDPMARADFTFHLSAGVDLTAPASRFVPVVVGVDVGGVGLGAGLLLELAQRPNVPEGTLVIGGTSAPNLGTMYGSTNELRTGALLLLGFDADLFRLIFNGLFDPKLGNIGKGG
jgi:hypothetical protein